MDEAVFLAITWVSPFVTASLNCQLCRLIISPKLLAPHWSFWNLHLNSDFFVLQISMISGEIPMFFLPQKPGAVTSSRFPVRSGAWARHAVQRSIPFGEHVWGPGKHGAWMCMVNEVQMMCKVRGNIMKQCNKHELICSSRTILICPDLCHERIIRPEALRQTLYHLQQAGDQRSTLSCYPNNYGNPWGSRKEISQTWFDFHSSVNLLEGILECHPIRTG